MPACPMFREQDFYSQVFILVRRQQSRAYVGSLLNALHILNIQRLPA